VRGPALALAAGVLGACGQPVTAAGEPAAAASAGVRFVDRAAEAGLTAVTWTGGPEKDHLLESTGTGAALADLDGDGLLDVYLVNSWRLGEEPSVVLERGRNHHYRNLGDGRFEDVTERTGTGDDGWGCGVCAGDIDGNGTVDLYVTNFGPNVMYLQEPDGTFREVAAGTGLDDPGWGAGCTLFDADGDGDLDLYVVNYVDDTMENVLAARRTNKWRERVSVMTGPFGMRGGRDRFFRNDGDARFTDVTVEAGLEDVAEAYGLGVVAADVDRDGLPDLYVANDSNPNYLYMNRGEGQFAETGGWSGAGYSGEGAAQAGMGVDAADLGDDGLPEIVVTNFARDHATLYENLGEGFFEDVTMPWGIREPTFPLLSWACALVDLDLDTDRDLVIVNGHIYPQVDEEPELEESYAQPILLLENTGGRFEDVTAASGPGLAPFPGRGLAVGDVDRDGDLDLLVTGMDRAPRLLVNEGGPAAHWLGVAVREASGAPAVNAMVEVVAGGRRQVAEIRSGCTYQSQGAFEAHFGLGDAAVVDTLRVRWRDGTERVETGVAADRLLRMSPGD
jgi:hypothetical protein